FEGRFMLPQHDLLVVDEAHELTDRVTSTITDELTAGAVAVAARRVGRLADTTALTDAGQVLQEALDALPEGRLRGIPERLELALAGVRDAARGVQSEIKPASKEELDGTRQVAKAAVDEVFDTAERVLAERELDVAWVSHEPRRGA